MINVEMPGKLEYLIYKVRQFSVTYGKKKAKGRRDKEMELEKDIKLTQEKLHQRTDSEADNHLNENLSELTAELEEIDNYKNGGLNPEFKM